VRWQNTRQDLASRQGAMDRESSEVSRPYSVTKDVSPEVRISSACAIRSVTRHAAMMAVVWVPIRSQKRSVGPCAGMSCRIGRIKNHELPALPCEYSC
jgi:hypothetical protein